MVIYLMQILLPWSDLPEAVNYPKIVIAVMRFQRESEDASAAVTFLCCLFGQFGTKCRTV